MAILVTGCGNYEPPELPPIDYYLVITDSIGVEEGDSNYVLVWPNGASFAPDGSVAVVDRMKESVLFYDSAGVFMCSVGRSGEGPGEFQTPGTICFRSDGSFLVSCRNGISIFNSDHVYIDRMTWSSFKPFLIAALDGEGFVGNRMGFDSEGQRLMATSTLGLWEGGEDPVTEYCEIEYEWIIPDEDVDFSVSRTNTIHSCATLEGRVFYARSSIEGMEIHGCEPDGTPFFHVRDYSMGTVRKSDEELQAERNRYTSHFSRMSSGRQMPFEMNLDPFKRIVNRMFVDEEERLWVWLGYFPGAVFRVYDMNGDILFHAMVDYPGDILDLSGWAIKGNEYGILAYHRNPEDYPRIYMLELVAAE